MTEECPVFGIFEGGGAKRLAHVGALEAAEANNLKFVGVAGASAGSIVAVLVSVGFRSDEIFDHKATNSNILLRHGKTTIGILGKTAWGRFVRFRRGGSRFGTGLCFGGIGLGALLSLTSAVVAWSIYKNRGHFSTFGLRETLNDILHERLVEIYTAEGLPRTAVPKRVLFKHLDYARFPNLRPLKIVATDLGQRALTVFDSSLTPDVEVAEAVAASVAIPLVFEPVVITSHLGGSTGPFVDGGLISNSPTWVFAEEKLAFERTNPSRPPVPIISFTLVDKTTIGKEPGEVHLAGGALSALSYLAAVVRTAIFGSQAVSQRFIEDVLIVPLETDLKVLDFDANWARVRQAYLDGRSSAAEHLKYALTIKPDRVRMELSQAHDLIRDGINGLRQARGVPPLVNSRANLIERFGAYSLRVTAAYNMQDDPDDRLLLDSRAPGAPEAFRTRSPVLVQPQSGVANVQFSPATKYERALVRQTLHSAICVPIFKDAGVWALAANGRPGPLGVFCFDSDEDLKADFQDHNVQKLLVERSVVLSTIFDRSDP